MKRAETCVAAFLLGCIGLAHAAESRDVPKEPTVRSASKPKHAASPEAPSPELLEFLGSWEAATGPWDESLPDREPRPHAERRPKETHRDQRN